jgi:hypothetical protein
MILQFLVPGDEEQSKVTMEVETNSISLSYSFHERDLEAASNRFYQALEALGLEVKHG